MEILQQRSEMPNALTGAKPSPLSENDLHGDSEPGPDHHHTLRWSAIPMENGAGLGTVHRSGGKQRFRLDTAFHRAQNRGHKDSGYPVPPC
jgi:hypothetical protein